MRLLWKILLLSIVVAVVPLAAVGWNVLTRIEDELLYSAVSARMEYAASDLAHDIDQQFVRSWARALETALRTQQGVLFSGPADVSPLPVIEAAVETHPDLIALQFYPTVNSGYLLTLRSDFATAVERDTLLKHEIVNGLLRGNEQDALAAARVRQGYISSPSGVPGLSDRFVTLSLPWISSSSRPGALVGTFSLSRMEQEVTRREPGGAGLVFVLDRFGDPVAGPRDSDGRWPGAITETPAASAVSTALLQSNRGPWSPEESVPVSVSTELSSDSGAEWRVAYAVCESAPWAVVAQESRSDALQPIRDTVKDLILLVLTGLGIAIAGGLILTRTLHGPIRKLAEGARQIGAGNFEHRIDLLSRDELGQLAEAFNQMAQQLAAYDRLNIEKLMREKSKTEAILRNVADGVIVTDSEDEILVVNEPAGVWFGVDEAETLGRPLLSAIQSHELPNLVREARAGAKGQVHTSEVEVHVPGTAKPIILQANAARVETRPGELIGVAIILRDVTSEREVDRMKTEIVSVVAHELRTPLVSVMGYSGILLTEELDEETRREFTKIISDEANRLTDMINKFLDISRIESGGTQLAQVPCDLRELVGQVIAVNRRQAEDKGIAVATELPKRVTPVSVDRDLVGQAILNLFSNAVKYSPADTTVTVAVREHEKEVEIAVVDEGYGISARDQQRLFQKFFRAESARAENSQGSGLGLALVREIVERHGGRVEVDSEPGKGSRFSMFFRKGWA